MSIASDAVPPELVDRFGAALERLNPESGRIGLAVSGGPDSMAMLLLAHAAIPGRFEVATVDHGLRSEAKNECALVVATCEARGVPCEVLTVQVGAGNLQARAREARYSALARWADVRSLAAIATAHHADDQAETLIMRLNRGSGVAGLAGIREATWLPGFDCDVMRPLLRFRRSELALVVESVGIETASDPSNKDESFDRVRIRKALAQADWLDPVAIVQSARHLAEASDALDWMASRHWKAHASRTGDELRLLHYPALPVMLKLMELAIGEFGGTVGAGDLARLHDRLWLEKSGNLGGVLVELVEEEGGVYLTFRPEPPRNTG